MNNLEIVVIFKEGEVRKDSTILNTETLNTAEDQIQSEAFRCSWLRV